MLHSQRGIVSAFVLPLACTSAVCATVLESMWRRLSYSVPTVFEVVAAAGAADAVDAADAVVVAVVIAVLVVVAPAVFVAVVVVAVSGAAVGML